MPAPRKPKPPETPQPAPEPQPAPPAPEPQPRTVTVTTSQRYVTRIRIGDHVFPVGHQVDNVPEQTIEALKAMPGVSVDVAGEPDADPPAPAHQE